MAGISCNSKGEGYIPPFTIILAAVVDKEICKTNPKNDYWLIDVQGDFGDTVTIEGTIYNHVVKTLGLPEELKVKGKLLHIDCEISAEKFVDSNCDVQPSTTYRLSIMKILALSQQPY